MGDGVALSSPLGPLAQPVSLELGAKRVEMLLVLPSESDLPLLMLGTKVGEHCSGVAGQQAGAVTHRNRRVVSSTPRTATGLSFLFLIPYRELFLFICEHPSVILGPGLCESTSHMN